MAEGPELGPLIWKSGGMEGMRPSKERTATSLTISRNGLRQCEKSARVTVKAAAEVQSFLD